MKPEEIEKIGKKYDILDTLGEFSCTYCKSVLKPSDCKGCPVYCQGFSDD